MTDIFPESREEEILVSTINGEEYNKAPESRIEALLLELKEVIEEGGGGGGTTNYNLLQNKPSINSVTLTGNKSLEDLSIPTEADLAGKQDVLPVTASGNDVAFNGDIIDGQGNTLSVLAEALTKTASGNPVVISDCAGGKARSLITTINAIQDLHGYDHPWAGGAGKNKLPMTVSGIKAVNTSGTWSGNAYTLNNTTFTILTDSADNVTGFKVNTGSGGASDLTVFRISENVTLPSGNYKLNGCTDGSESTYFIQLRKAPSIDLRCYTTDRDFTYSEAFTYAGIVVLSGVSLANKTVYPMIRLSTETDPTFAPYSNICPISGRTAATINDHGKNVLPNNIVDGTVNGITYTKQSDGSVKINGTSTGSSNRTVAEYHLQNGTWIVSKGQANSLFGLIVEAYNNNTWVKVLALSFSTDEVQFTVDNNGYNKIRVTIGTESGRTANNLVYYPMIRSASDSDPTYAPFVANDDVTIQLGQTVYGAEINWDTGVMTVKTAKIDMGSLTYTAQGRSDDGIGYLYSAFPTGALANGECISSVFAYTSYVTVAARWEALTTGHLSIIGNGRLMVCGTETTPEAFKTAVTGQDLEYKLATPTTIQLTPEQLEMLKGYNRVSIEDGTIEVGYIAKAISGNDEEIAPLVGDKATKSYAVNDFIERNDGLYRVTAPIASGASFTANNTVKMSIGEALTYLYNK